MIHQSQESRTGEAGWTGYAVLVRHGVTWWDSDSRGPRIEGGKQPSERVTGWLDLPLRNEGIQEALKTADRLKTIPIDAIHSSPLSRAALTAQAVHKLHPQVSLSYHPQLAAWNTGIYSGQLAKDVQPILDKAVTHPDTPIPQGETFSQFVQRFLPFAWQLVNDPRLLCIVTHGMNVEVLLHYGRTGNTRFTQYTGINASIGPGEALLLTPHGSEELAA